MNDYIFGALSGISQTIIGHPFDTYKVLLQNNKPINNLKIKNIMAGIKYPLSSSALICSLNFGSYSYFKNNLDINIPVSGALSGIVVTPIVFISDIGKVSRQVNKVPDWKNIKNQKGFNTVLVREIVAFSSYFAVFENAKQNGIHPFFAGGLAGLANWTLSYPIDVIRSRQIATNCSVRQAYDKGSLWRGFGLCAIRAVLVNSVGFYVYDSLQSNFDEN